MQNKGPCPRDDRLNSIFELRRTIEASFFKNFEESYDFPPGLNFTHIKTVIVLQIHGKQSMSGLCSQMLLEKGSFTPVAAKLIKHELVEKKRCSRDKRIFYLELTGKGEELAARFFKAHAEYMRKLLDRLSPKDQENYFDLIKSLNVLNQKINEAV